MQEQIDQPVEEDQNRGGHQCHPLQEDIPIGAVAPKFYGLPKVHKRDIPLIPVVSSRGTTTYEATKELSRVLKPLVGKCPHHIKNTKDFVYQIQGIQQG